MIQRQTLTDPLVGIATNRPLTLEANRILTLKRPRAFIAPLFDRTPDPDGLPSRRNHHLAMMQHQCACAKVTVVGSMPQLQPAEAASLMKISSRSVLCLDESMINGHNATDWLPVIAAADMIIIDCASARWLAATQTSISFSPALRLANLSEQTDTAIVVCGADRLTLYEGQRNTVARFGQRRSRLDAQPTDRGMLIAATMECARRNGESASRALFIAAAIDVDRGRMPARADTMTRMARELQSRVIRDRKHARQKRVTATTAISLTLATIGLAENILLS